MISDLIESILFKSSLDIFALISMDYTSTDFYNLKRVHGIRVYFIIIRNILLVEAENKQKIWFHSILIKLLSVSVRLNRVCENINSGVCMALGFKSLY